MQKHLWIAVSMFALVLGSSHTSLAQQVVQTESQTFQNSDLPQPRSFVTVEVMQAWTGASFLAGASAAGNEICGPEMGNPNNPTNYSAHVGNSPTGVEEWIVTCDYNNNSEQVISDYVFKPFTGPAIKIPTPCEVWDVDNNFHLGCQ